MHSARRLETSQPSFAFKTTTDTRLAIIVARPCSAKCIYKSMLRLLVTRRPARGTGCPFGLVRQQAIHVQFAQHRT